MAKDAAGKAPVEALTDIRELCRQPSAVAFMMEKIKVDRPGLLKFLGNLQRIGLLRFDGGSEKHATTEKGLMCLRDHSELQKLLR